MQNSIKTVANNFQAGTAESIILTDMTLLRTQAYIDGQWQDGDEGACEAVINPATNNVIAYVTKASQAQVLSAVDSAAQAFLPWKNLRVDERAAILRTWHDLILSHKEDLSRLMVMEQGKTLAEARGEINYAASFILWYAEEARRAYGETIPSHIPGAQLSTSREAIGVAALITPWNFPCAMITRKAAAALSIGCTVVVKPASETPLSALALAELGERAGLPKGVFNIVTGDAKMITEVLCASEKIKAISFTGSTRVGKIILAQSTATVKKCSLELGGNAPFIIMDDMDMTVAAKAAIDAKFQTSGQDCLAANRIFVPRKNYEDFLQKFKYEIEALTVGPGCDDDVDLGPLIHERAVKNAQAIVDDAIAKGARLLTGDQSKAMGPNFFIPTLLADVTPDMLVYREENFCPVAGVIPYDDLDSLIAMANDTEYGLAAYVFGDSIRDIWAILPALDYGMVSVNSVKMTGPSIPFGGVKQSGLGREGGRQGLEEFSELKYYCFGALPRIPAPS